VAKTKKAFISEIKRQMKSLGTYKKEYDRMIEIFAGMLHQYHVFEEQFAESGYQITELYTNKAGATNERKTPLYTAMESLRKDIATYSDRLCLNPKSLESITIEQQNKSKLAQVLSELS
jgi:phage terminase small subunit